MKHEIAEKIEEKPGIHLRELQRELECSSTTLNYHIRDLDVKEKKIHGYRRLYPLNTPQKLEKPFAALNHEVRGPMIYHINSGSSPKDLVEKLDVSKSTVSSHLKVLKEDEIVVEEKKGRRKDFSLNNNAIRALEEYASKITDASGDNLAEM